MHNPKNLKSKKLLIIEDHKEIREILKLELSPSFSAIYEAAGGIEALKLLKETQIDIIISDLVMVHGDGLWLMTKLKNEIRYQPKIFLCSAYGGHITDKMKDLGILHIFDKPIKIATMIPTITSFL